MAQIEIDWPDQKSVGYSFEAVNSLGRFLDGANEALVHCEAKAQVKLIKGVKNPEQLAKKFSNFDWDAVLEQPVETGPFISPFCQRGDHEKCSMDVCFCPHHYSKFCQDGRHRNCGLRGCKCPCHKA